jgi:hypothetical protein
MDLRYIQAFVGDPDLYQKFNVTTPNSRFTFVNTDEFPIIETT